MQKKEFLGKCLVKKQLPALNRPDKLKQQFIVKTINVRVILFRNIQFWHLFFLYVFSEVADSAL